MVHKMKYRFLPCIALSALIITTIPDSRGELLFYEGFDYAADSPLEGMAAALGASTAWAQSGTDGTVTITSESLEYEGLKTSGNAVLLTPETGSVQGRISLDATAKIKNSSVYFVSFLAQKLNDGTRTFALILSTTTGDGAKSLYLGQPSGGTNWAFGEDPGRVMTGPQFSNSPTPTLFVVKIDVAQKTAALWLNPTVGEPLPDSPYLSTTLGNPNAVFDGILLQSGYSANGATTTIGVFDEIRVGTELSDVLPPR
jgi:hypothetical protein